MLSRSELVNLMSFGLDHYVPVLRLKNGELWSLRYVASDVRESVTPIIEVLPGNLGLSLSNSDAGLDDAIRTVSRKLWTLGVTARSFSIRSTSVILQLSLA